MATYVNDLRLKEIATGDESGTWGTSTNTNLELIANAMGVGAEAIANASTHTITMADGTADEFRSTFLRLTGGGTACTVTLAPNTLSHTWIMRNETAAALTLTQGSGANVTIAAGQTKIVATDGAGSGAIVYEMDDLELAGNLAVGGTLAASGTSTLTGAVGINIAPTSYKLTVNSGATTATTAAAIGYNGDNGTNLYINTDHGNNLVSLYASGNASKEMRFLSGTLEVMRLGTTGNVGIGATTVNRKLEVAGNNNAGAKANYIRITDTDTTATANNQAGGIEFFTNDVTAGIAASMEVLYAGTGGGGEITFNTNASSSGTLTEALRIDESGNVGIGIAPSVKLEVNGGADGSVVFSGRSDGGNGNNQRFNLIAYSHGGGSGYGGGLKIQTRNSSNVFSDAVTIDSAGKVGIGTSSPTQAKLDILQESDYSSHTGHGLSLLSNASNAYTALYIGSDDTVDAAYIQTAARNTSFTSKSLLLNPNGGKVGIGEASPAATLHLDSTGVTAIAFDSDAGTQQYEMGTGYSGVGSANNFYLYNNTASSAALIVDTSGNLMVGATSLAYSEKLSIGMTTANQGIAIRQTDNANAHDKILFINTNGIVGYIRTTGSSTSYVTSSDQRLKENIADADDAGSKIDSIQVRKYDWKADGSHQDYGMVAQELQTVAPEAVSAPEDPDEMMGVDYSKLVPMLVKEIQSLRARVNALEAE